jgi:hypothetical protein
MFPADCRQFQHGFAETMNADTCPASIAVSIHYPLESLSALPVTTLVRWFRCDGIGNNRVTFDRRCPEAHKPSSTPNVALPCSPPESLHGAMMAPSVRHEATLTQCPDNEILRFLRRSVVQVRPCGKSALPKHYQFKTTSIQFHGHSRTIPLRMQYEFTTNSVRIYQQYSDIAEMPCSCTSST